MAQRTIPGGWAIGTPRAVELVSIPGFDPYLAVSRTLVDALCAMDRALGEAPHDPVAARAHVEAAAALLHQAEHGMRPLLRPRVP